ncbi:hypothetical protein [Arthrobacter sp. B1I2]|uniref:hypothetical protein n=1 Tax=Arthrobacter sp. B1I2 TaxID=3042263 RepID=UPI002783B8DC|nr:hypothetical protein [Arthrobacter sp. B1I2]MDQ0732189.1 hypothetical protein [Arthrobacter sp. B1I2]
MEQYMHWQRQPLPRPKAPRWPWFLAAGSVILPLIFLFVAATVNESAKIHRLVSVADGIAPTDWKLVWSDEPHHDITCIPFDHSCHTLYRNWEAPGPVDLQQLVDSTGYEMEIGTVYRPDCAGGYENRISIRLCVDDNEVSLNMND